MENANHQSSLDLQEQLRNHQMHLQLMQRVPSFLLPVNYFTFQNVSAWCKGLEATIFNLSKIAWRDNHGSALDNTCLGGLACIYLKI